MPEAKDEDPNAEKVVKTELKEDTEAPPKKKKKRNEKTEDGVVVKKDEEGEADAEEAGNDEDNLAPEAEPTHPRNEVPEGTSKFREDAVHVYGLDFLKTGHMEEIFGQFSHRYIEWINDSSANVVFRDAASARKALESLSYPKAGDEPWRRTPDILVHDDLPAVFLQMRLAAPSDGKSRKKGVPAMNPPTYVDEANRRPPGFSVASLYERREKAANVIKEKGKRAAAQALPTEEVDKRQKRAERFEATLEAPKPAEPTKPLEAPSNDAESSKTVLAAPDAEAGKLSAEEAEKLKAEEEAKRKQRAARFGAGEANADDTSEAKAAEASDAPATETTEEKAAEAPEAGGATEASEATEAAAGESEK